MLQLLSVSCSSEASHVGVNLMSDDASSWPINVDSLFAPLDEIQQQEQSASSVSSSPHSSRVMNSNLNFDVFDPSIESAAHDDSLFSGAPDFNVMSTTSVAGGVLVSWATSSITSYSVTQGLNVSITAQLTVTDLTGAAIQLSAIPATSISISVPSAYGTLSISSASSSLTFSTAKSNVSTLTFTGDYISAEAALTSLVFSASKSATVGAVNITYSISLSSVTTSFSLALTMNIAAPTTVAPTTVAPTTTAAPAVAAGAIRVSFSLGNVTSISVTASHPYLLQQHRAMLQAVLAHFTAQATVTLFINTTSFNLRLQADICSACNISAAYCNTTNPTPQNSRVIVIATEYVSSSQSTLATVDFNAVSDSSSTSSSSSSAGPSTALALLTVFESSTSLSSYSTLAHASVSSIAIACVLNGLTYSTLASYQSDCSSSSGVQWYVPVIVVVVVIGVLGIVVGVVLFARNWKKRQQLEQKNQALVGEDEASPVGVAPSNTTVTTTTTTNQTSGGAATAAAITPSPHSTTPTTTSTAGVNSGVVTATGLVPATNTTAAPTPAATATSAATNMATRSTPSSPPVSGGEVEMMPTNGEYPGVQPGLKFMYSAPDWEPELDEQTDGVGTMASEIHLDLDAPTGSTMPRLGATLDDNSSARFSYVPRDL